MTRAARRTDTFKLPDSWAPAGSTPIGSIRDLLAFGRTHLAGGLSPAGKRVISSESAARMQSVAFDMGTPNVAPMGHGWLLVPFGNTTVLSFSGASPGGMAVLVVVPECDFVFAAFGNDPRTLDVHAHLVRSIAAPRRAAAVVTPGTTARRHSGSPARLKTKGRNGSSAGFRAARSLLRRGVLYPFRKTCSLPRACPCRHSTGIHASSSSPITASPTDMRTIDVLEVACLGGRTAQ